jgi:hypothetical protein
MTEDSTIGGSSESLTGCSLELPIVDKIWNPEEV